MVAQLATFANNTTGNLASGTSGATSITVTTVTGAFPTLPSWRYFRIEIDFGLDTYEVCQVTAYNAGTGVMTLAAPGLQFNHTNSVVGQVLSMAELMAFAQSFNILNYGADPLGNSDSSAACNEMLAAMGATGLPGIGLIPWGEYLFDEQVLISNPNLILSGATPSSASNGKIAGGAPGPVGASVIMGGTSLSVPLFCLQTTPGVNLWNVALRNLRIIGQNTTASNLNFSNPNALTGNVGIQRIGCAGGGVKDCTIAGFTECLNSDLDPNDTGTASDWGVFKRVRCDVGTFTGSHVCHSFGEGASVTGMTVHNDVYSNRYEDCESVLASNAQTQYGWLFGWCDSVICDHPSVQVQGTPTGTAIAFAFQYGLNPALSAKVPADVEIRHPNVSYTTGITYAQNVGSTPVPAGTKPNRLYNPIQVNGIPITQGTGSVDNLLALFSIPNSSWNSGAALVAPVISGNNGTAVYNLNLYPIIGIFTARDTATTVDIGAVGAVTLTQGAPATFPLAYGSPLTVSWATTIPLVKWFYAGTVE